MISTAKLPRILQFGPRNHREIHNFRREVAAKYGLLLCRGAAKFGVFEPLPRNLHSARKNREIRYFTAKFAILPRKYNFLVYFG